MHSNRRPVVCATDFSTRANGAAAVAAQLARAQSTALWLVHVAEMPGSAALAAARRNLQVAAEPLRACGVEIEPLVLQGADPVQALVSFLRDETPALVVVASATKSPLDRWALGSFSERLAQSAPIPTLVVKDPAPFRSWSWAETRLRILGALDLKTDSDGALRWLRGLGFVGPYDLIPCYVVWRPRVPGEPMSAPANLPAAELDRAQRELRKQVRDHLGEEFQEVTVRVTHRDVASCLVDVAREKKAQLVVVGTHQRHGVNLQFHGSVSRALLRESGLNVLCVPTQAKFDPRDAHIPQFHRVLVATDFSELGNAAIPFACAICCLGGLVKVVHIMRPSRRSKAGGASSARALRDQLRDLIPAEMGARGQPTEVGIVEEGDVARGICAEAERFGADVVCLSSHGMGASRALQGSVTKAVLSRIRRPVFVVRRPEE